MDTSILEISIISGIAALVLGVLYGLARVQMMVPWIEIIKSVTLSWFIVSLPYSIVQTFWKKKNTNHAEVSFVTLCIFLLVSVTGAIPFAAVTGTVLCILGSMLFVVLFAQWIRETPLRRKACVLFLSVFFSVWLGAKMWSAQYLSPLFFEEVATMAAHPDDLWHMSISHMIQTYGVASVGIDGLVFLPYHVGNHLLLAEVSRELSLPIMDVYTLTYPVIFLPLLLFSLLHFSSFVRHNRTLWPLIFLVLGFIGFLPRVLQNALVLDSIFFFSESYTVGIDMSYYTHEVSKQKKRA